MIAAFMLAMSFAGPAQAVYNTTGIMNSNEYNSICTPDMNFTTGCTRASYQNEVEDYCNCTGDSGGVFTGTDGRPHKQLAYENNFGWYDYVSYKKRADNDRWQVTAKVYCDFWGCYDKIPG